MWSTRSPCRRRAPVSAPAARAGPASTHTGKRQKRFSFSGGLLRRMGQAQRQHAREGKVRLSPAPGGHSAAPCACHSASCETATLILRGAERAVSKDEAPPFMTRTTWLAGEPPLVGPDLAAITADDFVHRAARGERAHGLGEREALFGQHTLRLAMARGVAERELHGAQHHDLLRLLAQPRRGEGKIHPGSEHEIPCSKKTGRASARPDCQSKPQICVSA